MKSSRKVGSFSQQFAPSPKKSHVRSRKSCNPNTPGNRNQRPARRSVREGRNAQHRERFPLRPRAPLLLPPRHPQSSRWHSKSACTPPGASSKTPEGSRSSTCRFPSSLIFHQRILCSAPLQRQPGGDVGFVVHIGHDNLVPLVERLSDRQTHQPNEGSGVHAKRDFARIARIHQISDAVACRKIVSSTSRLFA